MNDKSLLAEFSQAQTQIHEACLLLEQALKNLNQVQCYHNLSDEAADEGEIVKHKIEGFLRKCHGVS